MPRKIENAVFTPGYACLSARSGLGSSFYPAVECLRKSCRTVEVEGKTQKSVFTSVEVLCRSLMPVEAPGRIDKAVFTTVHGALMKLL